MWILSIILVGGGIFGIGVWVVRFYDEVKKQHIGDEEDSIPAIEDVNRASSIEKSYFAKPDVRKMTEYNNNIIDGGKIT